MTDIVSDQHRAAEEKWLAGWVAGPQNLTYDIPPVQPGDTAPDLTLQDATGARRSLSEFWADGPALVMFLRHYGCGCLADRWDQLAADLEHIQSAGATVVGIGQAEPERTAAIIERRGYSIPILCDPGLEAYRAYGLRDGTVAAIFHDMAFTAGDRVAGERLMGPRRDGERALVDNPWQLPGEFVVGSDGTIVHAHRYQYCEDFPPTTVIMGALAAAA